MGKNNHGHLKKAKENARQRKPAACSSAPPSASEVAANAAAAPEKEWEMLKKKGNSLYGLCHYPESVEQYTLAIDELKKDEMLTKGRNSVYCG